jgi:hypothetical protein
MPCLQQQQPLHCCGGKREVLGFSVAQRWAQGQRAPAAGLKGGKVGGRRTRPCQRHGWPQRVGCLEEQGQPLLQPLPPPLPPYPLQHLQQCPCPSSCPQRQLQQPGCAALRLHPEGPQGAAAAGCEERRQGLGACPSAACACARPPCSGRESTLRQGMLWQRGPECVWAGKGEGRQGRRRPQAPPRGRCCAWPAAPPAAAGRHEQLQPHAGGPARTAH